jgi:uncharacterized protein
MQNKYRLVLDTNVFLVSLAKKYKYYWLFEAILNDKFDFCVSNEILHEYQETIEKRYGVGMINETLDFLLLLPNVQKIIPFYKWSLIMTDPDDNKFVDCAISANAHFIITNDKHFNILKTIAFPSIQILTIEQLEQLVNNGYFDNKANKKILD